MLSGLHLYLAAYLKCLCPPSLLQAELSGNLNL